MKYAQWIGWASSAILLITLMPHVGFTLYRVLFGNWVYTVSNIAILGTAIVGQCIYLRNKK